MPFERVSEARGVLAPIRLSGPVNGVVFQSALPARTRATSPYEIVDCRLALALYDFAAILADYNIVEVVHLSMYRPPTGRWKTDHVGSRHTGALAIDAAKFIRSDGTTLDVERDFGGHIGAETCGPRAAPLPNSVAGVILRNIVCAASDAKIFNVALTPHYNRPHRNHFHLEVTARVTWFLVH